MIIKMEINIKRFEKFIAVVNAIPDNVKSQIFYVRSIRGFSKDVLGGEDTMIKLASKNIPELAVFAERYSWETDEGYLNQNWGGALSQYLVYGINNSAAELSCFFQANPSIWGNEYSEHRNSYGDAFNQKSEKFPLQGYIDHWSSVFSRLDMKYKEGKQINCGNLRIFVDALNCLPEKIRFDTIKMGSQQDPSCGTPGCHAGLVSMVAEDIPELKEIYLAHSSKGKEYNYQEWGDALSMFLMGKFDVSRLLMWARHNHSIWENYCGEYMFSQNMAFDAINGDSISGQIIINKWNNVLIGTN